LDFVFSAPQPSFVGVAGLDSRFPVRRIFCIGRNYADHVREMGFEPAREEPFFFTKPADAIVRSGATIAFPRGSANVHHEVELVVAIGEEGSDIRVEDAPGHVYGYAVGNDLTRRDLQIAARDRGRPWDISKAFDDSAQTGAIHRASEVGHPKAARIWLKVNGETRQEADIKEMVWSVPELVAHLSRFQILKPGDLIYTGTPAGVGPLRPGDVIEAGIDGLGTLTIRLAGGAENQA
jgi:fumarylpyruvate hydrolase